jgi:hypothetical protein
MTDIINFVPLTARVEIRGQKLSLRGLEFEEIGALIYRFPKFREIKALNVAELTKVMDRETQGAVIAAAAGRAGNAQAEASFANLSLGERARIVAKIIEVTAPDGIGPFVDLMLALKPPPDLAERAAEAAASGGKMVLRSRPSSKRRAS